MSDVAITVENLGKEYRIGSAAGRNDTLRDALAGVLSRTSRQAQRRQDESFWALRDVSFEVKRGEVVGVIGRNGAGKSTLLKILSRITEPTTGRATIHGRVGSLLEVGTGFHPELTGRENIYLNGAILGMRRAEINRRFDEIVAFAEIDRFLDTPVKRYSSGMYVRLAFAVAAHLEPEILLVDEVLSVGDAAFQKKCLGKMSDVAGDGRTVLFVSHNLIALQSLCSRALWIQQGELAAHGPSKEVVNSYLKIPCMHVHEQVWPDIAQAPGTDAVRLHRVWIDSGGWAPGMGISREAPISIGVEYWHLAPCVDIHATMHVRVEEQVVAFTAASCFDPSWREYARRPGLLRSVCHIPGSFLNIGAHSLSLLLVQDEARVVLQLDDALSFEVVETEQRSTAWFGKEPGVVRPTFAWDISELGDEELELESAHHDE